MCNLTAEGLRKQEEKLYSSIEYSLSDAALGMAACF